MLPSETGSLVAGYVINGEPPMKKMPQKLPKSIPMFFLAFGLVALAAHAMAAPPVSPIPPISAAQALANKGQTMTVEGVASIHTDSRLGSYVDLDGKWPATHFSAYIPDGNEHVFPPLGSLEGHVVDITGTIGVRRGIATIIITDASQLRIVR
jgi:hypothetical protein